MDKYSLKNGHYALVKNTSMATKAINIKPKMPIVKKLLLKFSLLNCSGRPLMLRYKINTIKTAPKIPRI